MVLDEEKGEMGACGAKCEDGSGGIGGARGFTAQLVEAALLHFRPVFALVGPRQSRNRGDGHDGRL